MEVIELYLEDKDEIWYHCLKMVKGKLSWGEFYEALIQYFGEKGGIDEVEEFNKLQQTGTVLDYQERFEELRSLLLYKDLKLSENYFISSFISDLKDELKPMVRLLKPQTQLEAFEIAQIQEQSLEAILKRSKWPQKQQVE